MLKRSSFKAILTDLLKEQFGIGIRRDLKNEEGKCQEGFKGVGVHEDPSL